MILASELHTSVDVIEAWSAEKADRYLDATTRFLKAKYGKAKR